MKKLLIFKLVFLGFSMLDSNVNERFDTSSITSK